VSSLLSAVQCLDVNVEWLDAIVSCHCQPLAKTSITHDVMSFPKIFADGFMGRAWHYVCPVCCFWLSVSGRFKNSYKNPETAHPGIDRILTVEIYKKVFRQNPHQTWFGSFGYSGCNSQKKANSQKCINRL
jgi:hypothetical protein